MSSILKEEKLKSKIDKIEKVAKEVRALIINMLTEAKSGHPGGSLSCVEIITTLYFHELRHKPEDPKWEDRDRFVLSKGHACPTLYACLGLKGYFPMSEFYKLRKIEGILQGHPDVLTTPGVEVSTGSLGQGLSVAVGMALAAKLDKKDWRVYVLLGDGEIQEGQIWEAAMSAAHYKLDNLCALLDYNKYQIDGKVEEVMNIEPIAKKWEAFGWYTINIDGHNIKQIIEALSWARGMSGKPTIIICDTIKGKGVDFMENNNKYHGVAPTEEEREEALKQLCK